MPIALDCTSGLACCLLHAANGHPTIPLFQQWHPVHLISLQQQSLPPADVRWPLWRGAPTARQSGQITSATADIVMA